MEKEEINQEIKNLLIKKEEFDVTKDKLNNLFNLIKGAVVFFNSPFLSYFLNVILNRIN